MLPQDKFMTTINKCEGGFNWGDWNFDVGFPFGRLYQ